MLPIYLCEDSNAQRLFFTKELEKFILIDELDAKVVCSAAAPKELLSYLEMHPEPSLYYLDVDLQSEMNGFELARQIRKIDPRGFIIFITTHSELSALSFEYKVEAMDYILKDESDKVLLRMKECLLHAQELLTAPTNRVQKTIPITINGKIIFVKMADIYCIETASDAHKIRVHYKNGYTEFYYSLKDISKQLDENFFQCHKSCIVNMQYIKEIDKKNNIIILNNQKTCTLSMRQAHAFYRYYSSL